MSQGIILLLLIPFTATWHGFVFMKLWAWFIVPTFHVTALRIPEALGLALLARFVTNTNTQEDHENMVRTIGLAFFTPAVALFFGWILRFFL
jgi:hypothetical protein